MTINDRVKYFRKTILKLNQKEFAAKIGMKQTSVSSIEQPSGSVSNQTVKAICLAFNVNENWLRYGSGDLFVENDVFNFDEFIKDKKIDELEVEILKTYFELDEDIRMQALEHFKSRLLAYQNLQPDTSPSKTAVEEAEESYIKNRLNSVRNTTSSASNIIEEEKESKIANQ